MTRKILCFILVYSLVLGVLINIEISELNAAQNEFNMYNAIEFGNLKIGESFFVKKIYQQGDGYTVPSVSVSEFPAIKISATQAIIKSLEPATARNYKMYGYDWPAKGFFADKVEPAYGYKEDSSGDIKDIWYKNDLDSHYKRTMGMEFNSITPTEYSTYKNMYTSFFQTYMGDIWISNAVESSSTTYGDLIGNTACAIRDPANGNIIVTSKPNTTLLYPVYVVTLPTDSVVISSKTDAVFSNKSWVYSRVTGEEFIAPVTGTYKLEAWGEGTISYSIVDWWQSFYPIYGGYTSGEIKLTAGEKIYIYTGYLGNNGGGGGDGTESTGLQFSQKYYAGGGGATDFRTVKGDLYSRILVAGGAGASGRTYDDDGDIEDSRGGGGNSGNGNNARAATNDGHLMAIGGSGGTLSGGGAAGYAHITEGNQHLAYRNGVPGSFGQGGSSGIHPSAYGTGIDSPGGYGGGGWYGGGSGAYGTYNNGLYVYSGYSGGGGGSGYTSPRISNSVMLTGGWEPGQTEKLPGKPIRDQIWTSNNYYINQFIESLPGSAKITLQKIADTTPPVVEVTASTTSWTNQDVTLTFTAFDPESGIEGSTTQIVSASTNGTYSATFTNGEGLTATKSYAVTNIDKVAPTASYTINPTTWSHTPYIRITASDSESGINYINCPNETNIYASTTDYSVTANGTYIFNIYDKAGNITTVNVTVSNYYLIPSVPKKVSTTDLNNGNITISWQAPDIGDIKEYRIYNSSGVLVSTIAYPTTSVTLAFSIMTKGSIAAYANSGKESTRVPITKLILNSIATPATNQSQQTVALSWTPQAASSAQVWSYKGYAKSDKSTTSWTQIPITEAATAMNSTYAIDQLAPTMPTHNQLEVDKRTNNIKYYFNPSTDLGTLWSYYIEGIGATDEAKIISETQSTTLTSGLKGYRVEFTTGSTPTLGTSSTVIPVNSPYAEFTWNVATAGYIHIAAIDYAGNQSDALSFYYNPALYNNDIDLTVMPILDTSGMTGHMPTYPDTNRIDLSWTNSDTSGSLWSYELYKNGGTTPIIATSGTIYRDNDAIDKAAPNDTTITKVESKKDGTLKVEYTQSADNATTYTYYIKGTRQSDRLVNYSFNKEGTVKSGLAGYSILIDHNPSTIPDNSLEAYSNVYTTVNLYGNDYWIHIKPIDFQGNTGNITHFHYGMPLEVVNPPPSVETEVPPPIDYPELWIDPEITPEPTIPDVQPGIDTGEGGIRPPIDPAPEEKDKVKPTDEDGDGDIDWPEYPWYDQIFLDPNLYNSTFYEYDIYDGLGRTDTMGTPDFESMVTASNTWGLPMNYKWLMEGQSVSSRLNWSIDGIISMVKSYTVKIPFTNTITDQGFQPGAYKTTMEVSLTTPIGQIVSNSANTYSYQNPYHIYVVPKLKLSTKYFYNDYDVLALLSEYEATGSLPDGLELDDIIPKVGEWVELQTITNKYSDATYAEWYDQDEDKRFYIPMEEDFTYTGTGKRWKGSFRVPDTLDTPEYTGIYEGLSYLRTRITTQTAWGSKNHDTLMRFKTETLLMKVQPIKLFDFRITDITDNAYTYAGDTYVRDLAPDEVVGKGYGYYFTLSSKGLNKLIDRIEIIPRFFQLNKDGTVGQELAGYIKNREEKYIPYTTFNEESAKLYPLYYESTRDNSLNSHSKIVISQGLRQMEGSIQNWLGRYGVPGEAQFFRTSEAPIEENAYKGNVLIAFDISAWREDKLKYQYVEKGQWKREREMRPNPNPNKAPLRAKEDNWVTLNSNLGAVIIYDTRRKILDDYRVEPIWGK